MTGSRNASNNYIKYFRSILFIACAVSIFLGTTNAQTGESYYYDGGVKKTISKDDGLVAEFGSSTAVKNAIPSAEEVQSRKAGMVKIYRVPSPSLRSAVEKGGVGTANLSPVYRYGNPTGGRLMTLPGGVLVNFKADWSDGQIHAWSSAKGYALKQKLSVTGNWYSLETAAGQASLDAANAIHESGEVASATPNWWMETATK
jgi:hypothetical protein